MAKLNIGQIAQQNAAKPTGRPNQPIKNWNDKHVRKTFYISHELLERMHEIKALTGQSLSSQVKTGVDRYTKAELKKLAKAQQPENEEEPEEGDEEVETD